MIYGNKNRVIDLVELNVNNLENVKQFYHQVLKLKILSESSEQVVLGVDTPLLKLHKIESNKRHQTTGLYHVAFLVPHRKQLGEILLALYQQGVLSGASDHGYSEALYLNDPEGNGIEIYWDKDISEWDIKEDGRIEGITVEIDAQGLLSLVEKPFEEMPEGTKIGHVHLMVNNLKETQAFYENLGFKLISDFGSQAKFLAQGLYHHHIGTNTWHGELPIRVENQLGLRSITFKLDQIEPQYLTDSNGIQLKINLE